MKRKGEEKSYLPVYGVLEGQLDSEGTGILVFEMGVSLTVQGEGGLPIGEELFP